MQRQNAFCSTTRCDESSREGRNPRIGENLRGHALLVEGQELAVIVDLDALLKPRAGVADVELHGRPRKKKGNQDCALSQIAKFGDDPDVTGRSLKKWKESGRKNV